MQPAGPRISAVARPGVGVRPAAPVDRTRFSTFFVLANTNRAPPSDAVANAWGDDLQNAFARSFTQNWRNVISYRGGVPQPGKIDDIKINSAVEIGPHFGRLHMHAIVRVRHRVQGGGIHLDTRALRNQIRAHGSTQAVRNLPVVWVKAFTSEAALDDYILKGARTPLDVRNILSGD